MGSELSLLAEALKLFVVWVAGPCNGFASYIRSVSLPTSTFLLFATFANPFSIRLFQTTDSTLEPLRHSRTQSWCVSAIS